MASAPDQLVISTQVLDEFFWAVTRRMAEPLADDVALRLVSRLSRLRVVGADAPFVVSAIELAGRHQLALWDALIVRAAQVAGCERLLTEDLDDGARYGDVLVVNPFPEVRAGR